MEYDPQLHSLECPKCGHGMEEVSLEGITIDRCIWYEVCPEHGMFLDAGEFTDYKHETLLDFFRGIIKGRRGQRMP